MPDLDDFVERYHAALDEFFRGNPEPAKRLYVSRADVSLGNPFGPFAVGRGQVEAAMDTAAANYTDGRATGFETVAQHVEGELAYLLEVERFEAILAGRQDAISGALRVTSILRAEDGDWKLVHRHADPITAPRGADSLVDR